MLFPQLGPQYYNEKDNNILRKMEAFYTDSVTINQTFWSEADTDTRFEAGDQTLYTDLYGNVPVNRRKQFNFNRIRPIINMIDGYQRRNRKSTIVVPVENGDAETADQFSKILMWVNQQEGVLETISDSFHGSLISGMNLLQVWVDYRSDPVSGNIKVDNCSYNSFLIDPYFRKQDLSDCNAIWKRSFITKREAMSLLPAHSQEIMGLWGNDNGNGKDGKFQYMPESYDYGMKNLLTYDEYYYRDYRSQRMLVDSQTGETFEWKSSDEDALKQFLKLYPQVTVIEQDIPTVRLAIVVQGKVMYDGPNPMGIDNYPFVPVFSFYNPQLPYFPWRVTSMVRSLRDPQYLYNRFMVNMADILESQVNSGFIYKENALVDPKDIFLSGNGKGIALKEEAQMSDVQKIQPGEASASMFKLAEMFSGELFKVSGANEELMGAAVDDKSGILSMLRQGAGLTTLQILFDQLDRSQKLLGKLMIDIVQSNFTPGKVKRILEQEPTQQFYNKAFGKYDAAVEEGMNTTTQRQMQFAQLLQLREVGVMVPDDLLLEASTVQDKKKLVEAVQRNQQQAQQLQQMQLQASMQEQQARTQLAQARAQADRGLGLERLSRIDENQALAVERRAEAEKDQEAALLNLVKALKEIESIDIIHLEKLIALSNLVKVKESQLETNRNSSDSPINNTVQV